MSSTPVDRPAGFCPIEARIEEAKSQITVFTSTASALERDLSIGSLGADDRVGPALDQARAWVTYLSPDGPLVAGIPPQAPTTVAMGYLTQIAGFRRIAQQWVEYFETAWNQKSTARQNALQEEQACLHRIQEGEQAVNSQTMAFTMNSSNVSSYQMQYSINELNALLATLQSWRPEANRLLAAGYGTCSPRLEQLIQRLQSQLQLFRSMGASKRAFEASQGW
jgi:hypothetical protein